MPRAADSQPYRRQERAHAIVKQPTDGMSPQPQSETSHSRFPACLHAAAFEKISTVVPVSPVTACDFSSSTDAVQHVQFDLQAACPASTGIEASGTTAQLGIGSTKASHLVNDHFKRICSKIHLGSPAILIAPHEIFVRLSKQRSGRVSAGHGNAVACRKTHETNTALPPVTTGTDCIITGVSESPAVLPDDVSVANSRSTCSVSSTSFSRGTKHY